MGETCVRRGDSGHQSACEYNLSWREMLMIHVSVMSSGFHDFFVSRSIVRDKQIQPIIRIRGKFPAQKLCLFRIRDKKIFIALTHWKLSVKSPFEHRRKENRQIITALPRC